jgi:hypothetical protein
MAKGKRAAMAARKQLGGWKAAVAALEGQLLKMGEENAALRRKAVEQDALLAEITRLKGQVEEGVSADYEKLLTSFEKMLAHNVELATTVGRMKQIYDGTVTKALLLLGGGAQAYNDFFALATKDTHTMMVTSPDLLNGLPRHAIKAIERKRWLPQDQRARRRTLQVLRDQFPDDPIVAFLMDGGKHPERRRGNLV